MNIEGLGEIVADKLVERGLARSVFDLFRLDAEKLAALNLGTDEEPRRLGEKTARRIIDALDAARAAPLAKWLHALGLPGVGETIAIKLAECHRSLDELAHSDKLPLIAEAAALDERIKRLNPNAHCNSKCSPSEKLTLATQHAAAIARREEVAAAITRYGLEGIGPVIARDVIEFMKSGAGRDILRELRALGIDPRGATPARGDTATGPFAGKTVVVTGTLQGFSRSEAHAALRKAGAKVADSVTGKTDYLIVGADAGSKLDKARKLGVATLDEAQFRAMLETS
jgi:DNA ligase (NAD+)